MGRHRIPTIAARLRLNRGFDSAWYAGPGQYAQLLQKDWLVSKAVWSFVQRSSRCAGTHEWRFCMRDGGA